jgi:hypothetical protein
MEQLRARAEERRKRQEDEARRQEEEKARLEVERRQREVMPLIRGEVRSDIERFLAALQQLEFEKHFRLVRTKLISL